MEQNMMVRSSLLLVIAMWIGALIIYAALQKMKVKINNARSAEDMRQFGCGAAKRAMRAAIIFRKILLILICITAGYLIISTAIRVAQLISDNALDGLSLSELLLKLPNPDLFLGFIFILGAYATTIIFISYIKVLIQKCTELGVLGEQLI